MYVSPFRDNSAFASDALSISWKGVSLRLPSEPTSQRHVGKGSGGVGFGDFDRALLADAIVVLDAPRAVSVSTDLPSVVAEPVDSGAAIPSPRGAADLPITRVAIIQR